MRIGSTDIYANHPIVMVGSTRRVDDPLSLDGAAAVATDKHVSVATRGQASLFRVSLWKEVGPLTGVVVFDGSLVLADHSIAVFDVENLSSFAVTIGGTERHRFVILVDDPGSASRLDVIIDCGSGARGLRAVPGFRLFDVSLSPSTELGPSDELALILSGHDCPMNRLAAAIKLIGESPVARPAIKSFWIRMLVEWVRWLSPWQSLAESRAISAVVEQRLAGVSSESIDIVAVELASGLLRRITQEPGSGEL